MSKIAGLITDLPPEEAKAQLSSMVAAMVHEPFYTTGMYSVPQLGCYVGWVDPRGAPADLQCFEHKGRALVFTGEHFGDSRSHRPDGAALLARYEQQGAGCLRDLNGWFAGLLIDPRAEAILLFNDRLGLHRVHYTRTDESFAFASEAKSLLAIRPQSRRVDLEGLGEFFAIGAQLSERTLFHGVSRLPGGSAWSITRGREVRKQRYFTPDELEHQPPIDTETYYARLRGTLSEIIPNYMADDDPIAVSLTGGFDTRAIMAFDDRSAARRLSYTYGGMYRDCFDVTVGREVARACGYEHTVLRLDERFLDRFPECAEQTVWVTDGTLDISAAHEVHLSRLARDISPVRLTGNYGSEILRGVSTFKPLGLSRQLFAPDFIPYVEAAETSLAAIRRGHPASFAIFHEIPSSLYGRLSAAQSQLTVRSPYTDNALVSLAYQAPAGLSVTDSWTRLITERSPALAAIPTDRGQLGTASALASLPGRFYNHLLFKSEWYYESGMPDWLSRIDARMTGGRRPPFFAGSHKMQHYRLWFRDHLADYVDSLLNDSVSASRPYLNRAYARGIAADHRTGRRNCTGAIAMLVTAELIHRLFIDAPSNPRFQSAGLPELQAQSQ